MNNRLPAKRTTRTITAWEIILLVVTLILPFANGAIIWDGPTNSYTQPAPVPSDPANQDRWTPNVWLTRGSLQGLFNIRQEGSYNHNSSPRDTEWAYGELANYASLTYTDWEDLYGGSAGGGPMTTIGKDIVVHIISEDIYLSIQFGSFGGPGGGFSYVRSTPGVDPAAPALSGAANATNGTFQIAFTNTPGYNFTILGSTDLSQPLNNWTELGQATYGLAGPGFYQFTDPDAVTNSPQRFYQVLWQQP